VRRNYNKVIHFHSLELSEALPALVGRSAAPSLPTIINKRTFHYRQNAAASIAVSSFGPVIQENASRVLGQQHRDQAVMR
jgi:hypothetical protein